MAPALLVPFVIGALAVVQVGLNRRIAGAIGLMPAVILNAAVLLVVAIVFWYAARGERGQLEEWVAGGGGAADFRLWWVVPGLCGLALVAGMPWALERIGALQLFVVLVASQMFFSVLWDHYVEHASVTAPRIIGAALAITGAFVTTIKT